MFVGIKFSQNSIIYKLECDSSLAISIIMEYNCDIVAKIMIIRNQVELINNCNVLNFLNQMCQYCFKVLYDRFQYLVEEVNESQSK